MTSLLNADGRQELVSLANGGHIDEVVRTYRIAHAVQLRVIPAAQTPSNPTGLLATDRYRDVITNITALNELRTRRRQSTVAVSSEGRAPPERVT